jgi:hypothetical protein
VEKSAPPKTVTIFGEGEDATEGCASHLLDQLAENIGVVGVIGEKDFDASVWQAAQTLPWQHAFSLDLFALVCLKWWIDFVDSIKVNFKTVLDLPDMFLPVSNCCVHLKPDCIVSVGVIVFGSVLRIHGQIIGGVVAKACQHRVLGVFS